MDEVLQVCTTAGSQTEAEAIANHLIEKHLAACVQVSGPIRSIYRWNGQVESSTEWQCLAKTLATLYPQVESAIRSIHSYDEPEIIATPVTAGSQSYLQWVRGECRGEP